MSAPSTPHQLTPAAVAYVRSRYPRHLYSARHLIDLIGQAARVAREDGRAVIAVNDIAAVEARRAEDGK